MVTVGDRNKGVLFHVWWTQLCVRSFTPLYPQPTSLFLGFWLWESGKIWNSPIIRNHILLRIRSAGAAGAPLGHFSHCWKLDMPRVHSRRCQRGTGWWPSKGGASQRVTHTFCIVHRKVSVKVGSLRIILIDASCKRLRSRQLLVCTRLPVHALAHRKPSNNSITIHYHSWHQRLTGNCILFVSSASDSRQTPLLPFGPPARIIDTRFPKCITVPLISISSESLSTNQTLNFISWGLQATRRKGK